MKSTKSAADLPAEYVVRKHSKYQAEEMVRDSINDAIEATKPSDEIRSAIRFEVSISETYWSGSYYMTSLRIGRRSYRPHASDDRVRLSSKRNQSIDMKRAVAMILERAVEDRKEMDKDLEARAQKDISSATASRLERELDIQWSSGITIRGASSADQVEVSFKKVLDADKAAAIVRILQSI